MPNGRYSLDACPFCGCGCAKIQVPNYPERGFFVRCAQCKARTRIAINEGAAAALWNKRAKSKG